MADIVYTTGKLKTASNILNPASPNPELVEFVGVEVIGVEEVYYKYDKRLNRLAALSEVELIEVDHGDEPHNPYDYIVVSSGGLQAKTEWFSSIDEQVFWDRVAIDTHVEVSTNNTDWIKAHFAVYEEDDPDGKPYFVYEDGKTSYTVTGSRESYSITLPGFSSQGGKYFRIYSNIGKDDYYIWFNLNAHTGGSTDPAVPGYIGIPVKILTGDTAASIAQKTYTKLTVESEGSGGIAEAVAWGSPWPVDPGSQPSREFFAMYNPGTSIVYLVVKGTTTTYDANSGTSGVIINIVAHGGNTIGYQYARLP